MPAVRRHELYLGMGRFRCGESGGGLWRLRGCGFLNLDETRSHLRITSRSEKTARAEYVVEESIRAVLFLKRASD